MYVTIVIGFGAITRDWENYHMGDSPKVGILNEIRVIPNLIAQ